MVYVAFIFDVFSRMIVGWRAATSMTTDLVLDTLEMAIWNRARAGVTDLTGLIHHSDGGVQFRSRKLVRALGRHQMVGSMGRVGAAGGNAAMESFFALLQKTVLNHRSRRYGVTAQGC